VDTLLSGKQIATRYSRHERWVRLDKHAGMAGELSYDETALGESHPHRRRNPPSMVIAVPVTLRPPSSARWATVAAMSSALP
jgi:hypothetical protein